MLNDLERRPSNEHIVDALTRLIEMLKIDEKANQDPPHISHYREIPEEVTKAYELLSQGAQMVHSTATKYTLVGKIDITEQKKLGADLLSGCELLGAATHVLLQDMTGCSRAVRKATHRATMSILLTVIHLASAFCDQSALSEGKNIAAQRTGAVWDACDKILNRLLPLGNRNAIRRELFTWTRETNDSMEEFQEMIDRGPKENDNVSPDDEVGDELDDLFGEEEDQYLENDLPIAKACLGILKCSRGTMKLTLDVLEDQGTKYAATQDQTYLDSISNIFQKARLVGEGVTDLGSSMYPPILPDSQGLESQLDKQVQTIIGLLEDVLTIEGLPSSVLELAHVLKVASETRHNEFNQAVELGKQ